MTESRLVLQDMKVQKVNINKQLRAEAPRLTFPCPRSDVRNAKTLKGDDDCVHYSRLLVFCNIAVFAQSTQVPPPNPAPTEQAADAPKIPTINWTRWLRQSRYIRIRLLSQVLVASTYPLELIQLQHIAELRPGRS